jgi:hypothetical protein
MGNLRIGHIVEAGLWLGLSLILYIYSFEFERDIEIYKFGATAWPRTIILLIAIAAIGQLIYNWREGDGGANNLISAANVDDAEDSAKDSDHSSFRWYLSTFGLLAIPFAYLRVPDWIGTLTGAEGTGIHIIKIAVAAVLIGVYMFYMRRNRVGAMLTLPIFFAAMMEDMGFYALAPFFIIMVMFLMGERRTKPMVLVAALIFGLLLLLFVSLLYVGLPTGNIHPFYDFGTTIVNILQ